jgi:hypothetical protein
VIHQAGGLDARRTMLVSRGARRAEPGSVLVIIKAALLWNFSNPSLEFLQSLSGISPHIASSFFLITDRIPH